ncbi:2597_t:CDS:1 [Ambispora leptoticha]|uniref:2597_t:CDS:1 n=1 Tax=Ambispora leptoticha TaxID=144679 RepID=A0A9N8VP79_9GLOM|nr:2597_t:CDS:1 [Ambispora leptoticha]
MADNQGLPSSSTSDANNNSTDQSSSSEVPKIKVNFVPKITIQELLNKRKPNDKLSKPPNAFIIYRGEYLKEAKRQKIAMPMTKLSQMASISWREEEAYVKKWYNDLSNEVAEKWAELHVRSSSFVNKNWQSPEGQRSKKGKSEKKSDSKKSSEIEKFQDELTIIHEYGNSTTPDSSQTQRFTSTNEAAENVIATEPMQLQDLQESLFLLPFSEYENFYIESEGSTSGVQNIYTGILRTEYYPSYSGSTTPLIPIMPYYSPADSPSAEEWLFPSEGELSYEEFVQLMNVPDDFIAMLSSTMATEHPE